MSVLIPSQARKIQSLHSQLTKEVSFQESSYFISDNLAEIGSQFKMHQILVIKSTTLNTIPSLYSRDIETDSFIIESQRNMIALQRNFKLN